MKPGEQQLNARRCRWPAPAVRVARPGPSPGRTRIHDCLACAGTRPLLPRHMALGLWRISAMFGATRAGAFSRRLPQDSVGRSCDKPFSIPGGKRLAPAENGGRLGVACRLHDSHVHAPAFQLDSVVVRRGEHMLPHCRKSRSHAGRSNGCPLPMSRVPFSS